MIAEVGNERNTFSLKSINVRVFFKVGPSPLSISTAVDNAAKTIRRLTDAQVLGGEYSRDHNAKSIFVDKSRNSVERLGVPVERRQQGRLLRLKEIQEIAKYFTRAYDPVSRGVAR